MRVQAISDLVAFSRAFARSTLRDSKPNQIHQPGGPKMWNTWISGMDFQGMKIWRFFSQNDLFEKEVGIWPRECARTIENISRIRMDVARASGTDLASSLRQNTFLIEKIRILRSKIGFDNLLKRIFKKSMIFNNNTLKIH